MPKPCEKASATFNALALGNKRIVYGVLFDAVARTLSEVAANPKHLGAQIGFIGILHTWGQNLSLHPHIHCVVPGGGLSADGSQWIGCKPGFFLPVRVLSKVFRGKFIDLLKRARDGGKLTALKTTQTSTVCSTPRPSTNGSFTPSRPLADPNRS